MSDKIPIWYRNGIFFWIEDKIFLLERSPLCFKREFSNKRKPLQLGECKDLRIVFGSPGKKKWKTCHICLSNQIPSIQKLCMLRDISYLFPFAQKTPCFSVKTEELGCLGFEYLWGISVVKRSSFLNHVICMGDVSCRSTAERVLLQNHDLSSKFKGYWKSFSYWTLTADSMWLESHGQM